MIIAFDIGNTNIVGGIFDGDDLVCSFRISTDKNKTFDEYSVLFLELINKNSVNVSSIKGAIVACVVPTLSDVIEQTIRVSFDVEPLIIDTNTKTEMPILCDNPGEVGADRIVNGVSAYNRYKHSVIVVDFGTATTFDCISENGEYLGGVITPGITISSNALFLEASKLPRVEFVTPKRVIGKNTIESIQSGLIYGYSALVDGLIDRIKAEMGSYPKVISTGGLARFISKESRNIEEVDDFLTLRGLKIIYDLNV